MIRAIVILFVVVNAVACVRDHLYYATSDEVVVRLNIDWSVSKFTPNGVTVYVYGSDGNRYGSSVLSSNINQVNMTLPADTYTIVVHNDSRSEFSNVEFINSSKLSTFMVRSLEWSHPYYEPETDEFVAYEPEDIVSATVRDVVVTGNAAKYHYDKPDLSEYTSSEVIEVEIVPAYIVHLAEVQAHVENAHNTVSIPIALVHGMSRGYYFGMECTSEQRVLEEFYVDVGVVTSAAEEAAEEEAAEAVATMAVTRGDYDYEDDDIYLDFRTFGLPFDIPDEISDSSVALDNLDDMHRVDDDYHDIYLELLFYMADGLLYHVFADVTESVTVDDIEVRKKYTIFLNDDINDYEPYQNDDFDDYGDEELSSGVMDPTLDVWIDIVVPLPI